MQLAGQLQILFYLIDPSDVQVHLIDTVVNETFRAVFECVIAGFPRPNISWYYGDNIINNMTNPAKYMTHINESFNGELYNISTTLTIMDATKADEGSYNCIGSNAVANYIGATEQSSAKLIVQGTHILVNIVLLVYNTTVIT